MAPPQIPFIRIDASGCDALYDSYPPRLSAEFTRKDFIADWGNAYRVVRESLEQHWNYGIGDGDFFIYEEYPEDQLLFIEITTMRMIDSRLLPVVHRAVSNLSSNFAVAICNDRVFLRLENGDDFPNFNIFVERTRVLGYSESDWVLQRLGIGSDGQ